jgi:thioredoxin 1
MSVCAIETEDAYNAALKVSTKDPEDPQRTQKLVVIDFHAVWCGPCRGMAGHVAELANNYSGVSFYKLDVDNFPSIAAKHDIRSMPTFVLCWNGEAVQTVVGADRKGLEAALIKQGAIKKQSKINEL